MKAVLINYIFKVNEHVRPHPGGGGHLGTFWAGMCRPGLQIGTPF